MATKINQNWFHGVLIQQAAHANENHNRMLVHGANSIDPLGGRYFPEAAQKTSFFVPFEVDAQREVERYKRLLKGKE